MKFINDKEKKKPKNKKNNIKKEFRLSNEPLANAYIPYLGELERQQIPTRPPYSFSLFFSEYPESDPYMFTQESDPFMFTRESDTFMPTREPEEIIKSTESPMEFDELIHENIISTREPEEITKSTESPMEFDEESYLTIIKRLTRENLILVETNSKLVNQNENFKLQLQNLNNEIIKLNEKIEDLIEARTSRFRVSREWLAKDLEELEY